MGLPYRVFQDRSGNGYIGRFTLWLLMGVGLVGICVMGLSTPVCASLLTNTEINMATFNALMGTPVASPLERLFDFEDATPGGDGKVTSRVYEGAGSASGLYVYVYQIDHFASSSELDTMGMALDFHTNPVGAPVDGMTSFFVNDPGAPGSDAPDFADWTNGTISFFFYIPDFLARGVTSYMFGTFSPQPPIISAADLLGTGGTILSPEVYSNGAHAPEPSTLLLLGSGLAGLLGLRRKGLTKTRE